LGKTPPYSVQAQGDKKQGKPKNAFLVCSCALLSLCGPENLRAGFCVVYVAPCGDDMPGTQETGQMTLLGVCFVSFLEGIDKLPQIDTDLRELIVKSQLGVTAAQRH
jgi:hypothetical protein